MRSLIIGKNEAGQRLDKLLGKYLNQAGKGFLYKMIRKKNITLNGKRCEGSEKLREGDEVRLFLSEETIEKFSGLSLPKTSGAKLDILYEDAHILLVNKPAGLLSQKASDCDVSLVENILVYLLDSGQLTGEQLKSFRPSVCNRLDRNTTGIVAAGKSLPGLQILSAVFKERSLCKYYRCIVKGTLKERRRITGFLTKDSASNRVTVASDGRGSGSLPIVTEYVPLAWKGDCTLLEVELITGRSHQIRAHLASIGHPIAGDGKYGNAGFNLDLKKRYGVNRQLLHAFRLRMPDDLPQPLSHLSGREFTAPLPDDFLQVMKGEGLWEPGIREA